MTPQKVYQNLDVDRLVSISLRRKETVLAKNGALVVYTGKYTGRSPGDKFIVDSPTVHRHIDWKAHQAISQKSFDRLYQKMNDFLGRQKELFMFDGYVGADAEARIHTRVISQHAYLSLFSTLLLRRSPSENFASRIPELTVLSAPECLADPAADGTNSEVFVVINIDRMIALVGGTKYAGEVKKAIFTVMNILLPFRGMLPMHCSANVGKNGKTTLFFGLSGTGKTTLSADPERFLIGDDEHGWNENGIFNFEGGCYAKCIGLRKESEPQIWSAVRRGTLLENVILKENKEFDFDSAALTENTRAAYPLEYIENAVTGGTGEHPDHIIFLTADAHGVLPPVAKLTTAGALYYFRLGYTSKVAGTERGIKEPKATFSPFFGGPFMPLKARHYIRIFKQYLKRYRSRVYLVNTGWLGGAYGTGTRIAIGDTRRIVRAIVSGELDGAKYRRDRIFHLSVPRAVSGVDSGILQPRLLWKDKKAYDEQAKMLVHKFESAVGRAAF